MSKSKGFIPAKESSIKIIKRTHRESLLQEKPYSLGQAKTEKQLARELFKTIASWVEERKEATKPAGSGRKDLHRINTPSVGGVVTAFCLGWMRPVKEDQRE